MSFCGEIFFLRILAINILLNIFRQQSREVKHSPIQESSSTLKSPTSGTSQSRHSQRRVRTLANQLCKPTDARLVFTSFKIMNLFNVKDAVLEGLCMRVVYKFSRCASCNACYVGKKATGAPSLI